MQPINLKREDLEKIVAVKNILEKEYHRHYTQKDLARFVCTNEKKLKLGFKQVTQRTLHEYLTLVRIEKSKLFLAETDYPIKLIADKIGLDKTNFNKSFKKLTGTTPKEWRNNISKHDINSLLQEIMQSSDSPH
ncbi:helix-turn-helix transcriptional regulator [Niastella caeni]|uniref:Helix-turn-helix transcriptional regulator n=1 Tax=Niastella caeni TaxID=2569763 RepID=A0A4S8HD18_9BACT|nr:AraC family transcriptional regulator [Niastella caeni]THU32928.1 helix-turn-helix transcriptional regulator [Niastella caeni]